MTDVDTVTTALQPKNRITIIINKKTMENKQNRFLGIHYQLYNATDEEKVLIEQTSREHPFQFISGFGVSLNALEQRIIGMEKGTPFDITLQPEEAFGNYDPEGVHKLGRDVFCVNGQFDKENIYLGAIITMNNAEGQHFLARVTKIEADGVTIDTNHPLAGQVLNFVGIVTDNREATEEEVNQLIKQLTGGCSGCGGGDCDCDSQGKSGCGGCGHCH